MSKRYQTLPYPVDGRLSGPQGTLLFPADDLRQYARETEPPPDGRASVHAPVLEGTSGRVEGLRFNLGVGRQTIGRGADNDVIVDSPSVSTAHAWIISQRGKYVILNTLSSNGTFVNDKRIHEAVLKHNDRIRFGQAEFVFLTRERGAASPARLCWILAGSSILVGLAALVWWFI